MRMFKELNERMIEDRNPLVEYYHEMKMNLVKILNEIVKYYVFRDPNKITYEGEVKKEI